MRKLMTATAALCACAVTVSAGAAWADADVQPAGSVPIPDGPAQTWIVADLDSGQVLAGRDQNVAHPPASTIKVLLALVALDELDLNSTVVADVATHRPSATASASNRGAATPRASCSTACCWCRATTPPTRWRTCWVAKTSPWPR